MAPYSTCSYTIEVDRVGLRDWIEGRREKKKAAAEAEAAAKKAKDAATAKSLIEEIEAEMAAERRRIPQAKKYLELAKISLDKEEFADVDDNLSVAFGKRSPGHPSSFQYFQEEVVSLGWDILDPDGGRSLGGRDGRHNSDIFYWVSHREEEYRRRKTAELEVKLVEAEQNLKLVKKWIGKEDFPKAKKSLGLAFASLSWTETEWWKMDEEYIFDEFAYGETPQYVIEAMFRDFEEWGDGDPEWRGRRISEWQYGGELSENPHWFELFFPKNLEWMKGWLSEVISKKEGKYLKKEAARKKAKAKAAKAAAEKKKAKAKAAKAAAEKKKAAAEAEAAAKKAEEEARVKAEKEQEEARVKAEKEQEEARVKAAAEAAAKIAFQAHWNKLDEFCIDQNISDELQEMVAAAKDFERMTPIDDVAHIHVRGWISHPNMHPIILSILDLDFSENPSLTLDDGDYLFTYREHDVLLEALGAGTKSMDWAKQLLESGFADNVKAMEMVVGGMSESAARKTFELGPEPDPVSVPIPDTDDDEFDSDDEDNELLL
jgi:pyruvate/2-oxoglutarate dehydrogenase complex dihydrolipoamide acyltransferase (E2) component